MKANSRMGRTLRQLARRCGVAAITITAASLVAAGTLASCGGDDDSGGGGGKSKSASTIKVALVLDGAANDGGFNTAWTNGAKQAAAKIDGVKLTVVPNVAAGAPAQRTFDTLGQQGFDLVVSSGAGHGQDIVKVAPRYPDTHFVGAFGTETAKNVSQVSLAIEQGRYLDGIVAGLTTKSNVIGFVAGYSIPLVNRPLNAFVLGAQSVNPDVVVKALFVNSWYDPTKERQAALALVGSGADVLGMDTNSPAVGRVAKLKDAGFVGDYITRESTAPEQWLTTFEAQWGAYIEEFIKQVKGGTWKPDLYYWGLKEGAVTEAPYGPRVSDEAKAKVDAAKKAILSGKLTVFTGPIKDNKGKVRVPDGETISNTSDLNSCCTWLIEGVQSGD
jgi:basic membrane protein A and related proteins